MNDKVHSDNYFHLMLISDFILFSKFYFYQLKIKKILVPSNVFLLLNISVYFIYVSDVLCLLRFIWKLNKKYHSKYRNLFEMEHKGQFLLLYVRMKRDKCRFEHSLKFVSFRVFAQIVRMVQGVKDC